jgi:hypothetical protein
MTVMKEKMAMGEMKEKRRKKMKEKMAMGEMKEKRKKRILEERQRK